MTEYQYAKVLSFPVQRSRLSRVKKGQRHWTVDQVIDEAARVPGACPHVERPLPPTVIGVPIETLRDRHAVLVDTARVPGQGEDGYARVRKDTHTLFSVVATYPEEKEKLETSEEERKKFRRWAAATIYTMRRYFRERGVRIITVVFHKDETFWHMHLLGLPGPSIQFNARLANPAWAAKLLALSQGRSSKEGNEAAKAAYSRFLDFYHLEVGSRFGHQRTGRYVKRLNHREALEAREAFRVQQAALAAGHERQRKNKADQDERERTLRGKELALERERMALLADKAATQKLADDLHHTRRDLTKLAETYRKSLARLGTMQAEAKNAIQAFADQVRERVYKEFPTDIARRIFRFFDTAEKDASSKLNGLKEAKPEMEAADVPSVDAGRLLSNPAIRTGRT